MRESYTPSPTIIDLDEVRDIKQWVGDSIEEIHGHTGPHHYRFKLVNGKVQMTYKHWSSDPKWKTPTSDTPLDLIKKAANLPSITSLITPDISSLNLEQLLTDLSRLPSDYIPPNKLEQWNLLVSKLSASNRLPQTTKPLPKFTHYRTSSRAMTTSEGAATLTVLPPSIQKLVDKSNERPPVSNIIY